MKSFTMKRRQKRVLQMALVFTLALIFLPNVGLWSLYREKHLIKAHEDEQVSGRLWVPMLCFFGTLCDCVVVWRNLFI